MPTDFFHSSRRSIATLTILSFFFSQASPVWALRPVGTEGGAEQSSPLNVQLENRLREVSFATAAAGLEGGSSRSVEQAVSVLSRLTQGAGAGAATQLPKVEAGVVPSSEVVVSIWSAIRLFPEDQKDLAGKVIGLLNILEALRRSDQAPQWNAEEVHQRVGEIASQAPGGCATCAARGLVSLADDRSYHLSESLQPLEFRDAENITALLIALDVWTTGQVQSLVEPQTGHQVFANTLGSVQVLYQASELGLSDGLRREWLPRILTLDELRDAVRRGPVVVHVGSDHYARIVGADDATVTLQEIMIGAGGTLVPRRVTQSWENFLSRWAGTSQKGIALVAVRTVDHTLPGRPVPKNQWAKILGCCGVSNASGLDGLFSRAAASRLIVQTLESRGFDNFASAHKMVLELPENFAIERDEYENLRKRMKQAQESSEEDVIFVPGADGRPPEIRFLVVSRGVGSATANSDVIDTDIAQKVREVARMVYGSDVEVRRSSFSGHWHVMRGHKRVQTIREVAVADHTRFKTKGGDRAENAHHKPYKGVSLGENGDLSEYEVIRAMLVVDFGESFEGTADWEPITHVIGDLQEVKNTEGGVVGRVPLWRAQVRAMRLLENVEALMRASEVLQPAYVKGEMTQTEQTAVRSKLRELGFSDENMAALAKTEVVGDKEVPVFVRNFFAAAIRQPALMDQEASAKNGWQGYYRRLGAQLPQTHDNRFDNFKAINLSLNTISIYDESTAVVTRTYPKSTSFYFGFDRNEAGETVGILGGSETRGFAPLIGKAMGKPIPIREGIVDLVSGEVEQLEAQAWSVYTVYDTRVVRHDIWDETSEEYTQGEAVRIKWRRIHPGKEWEYREWTDFRLETQAQPITLGLTIGALTVLDATTGARQVHLGEATEASGTVGERLKAALANPDTILFGSGSGTSGHALLLVDQQYHLFDRVASSDEWGSTLPVNLIRSEVAAGRPPVFVIVSQSGTTGSAKALVQRLVEQRAIVVVLTNRPGSDLYIMTKDKSGVVVTESIDELAVAATGSNSSQVAALEFLAMKRREALASETQKTALMTHHSRRIEDMIRLTTYKKPDGSMHHGVLEEVLNSLELPPQPGVEVPSNLKSVQSVVRFLEQAGLEEERADEDLLEVNKRAFRKTNFILTASGAVAQAIGPEMALKIMEVTRKLASYLPLQQLLAYGINGTNPRGQFERQDLEERARTIEANLKRYTTGHPSRVGRYPYFPRLLVDDPRLTQASQVILMGDGEDLVSLDYVVSRYQPHSTVPIRRDLYTAASKTLLRANTLVIAVQPWTQEQRELLEGYRRQGATVIVVASPGRPLEGDILKQAQQDGTYLPTEGPHRESAQIVVLDLLMMRVMEALKVRSERGDYTRPGFIAEQVAQIEEQIQGIRDIKQSFQRGPGAPAHRNLETLNRFKTFAKRRGWDHFDWWSTGKGVRFPAARDLALRLWGWTGKIMEAAELSEFKHGRNGATNWGDVFVNFWSPRGTPDWDDDRKTAIDEEVPRIADYPYPIFGEKEPGLIVLIAAEDDNDPYLRHLTAGQYRRLRQARQKASSEEYAARRQAGTLSPDEETNRPDLVFVTPHQGILEQLALNQILAEELSTSMFEAIDEAEKAWEEVAPRNLVINIDVGEIFPGKQDLYEALRSGFPADRNRILSVVSEAGSGLATPHSDDLITVPTGDPIAFLVVGHQLTTRLVEARFDRVLNFLVSLNHALTEEIAKGSDGEIGKYAPEFRTPGDLVMAFALNHEGAGRALRAFSTARQGPFLNLDDKILDILDWYNIDPIKGVRAARNLPELWHSVVDLIEKLAKTVTNFSAIGVAGEAAQPFQFARMPVTVRNVDQMEVDRQTAQSLQQDAVSVDQLRRLLEEVRGQDALGEVAEDNSNLAEVVVRQFAPVLVDVLGTLRTRYPTLPKDVEVVLEVRGPRLAHQRDGRLVLNVHALRHSRLVEEQLEHELLHELAGLLSDEISIPDSLSSGTGLSQEEIREALTEVAIVEMEAERHFSFSIDDQHAVREVIQGPNVVDTHAHFDRFLTTWEGMTDSGERHQLAMRLIQEVGGPQSVPVANLRQVATLNELGQIIEEVKRRLRAARTPEEVLVGLLPSPELPTAEELSTFLRRRGRGVAPAEDLDWFAQLYHRYLETRGLEISTLQSAQVPDQAFIVAVFPYERPVGSREVNLEVNDHLRNHLVEHKRSQDDIRQIFFAPFPPGKVRDQAGLLLVGLSRDAVADSTLQVDAVVRQAIDPYLRIVRVRDITPGVTVLPTVPTREVLAPPQQAAVEMLRAQLVEEVLQQFNPEEPEILFRHRYLPEANVTVLVVMGETDQPGLIGAVSGPLMGINILDDGPVEDHGDISYFVAQGQVPQEVLDSIADQIRSIVPLHFDRQMRNADPLLTLDEDIEVLHLAYGTVRQRGGFDVRVSASPYNESHSRITVALQDLPPNDPRREEVMDSIRRAIQAQGRSVLGAPLDTVYRGVWLLQLTVDNREGSATVRGAMKEIEGALRQLTAAGLEGLLVEGTDYALDDNNSAVFLRSIELDGAVTLPNGVTLNPQGGRIVVGEGTVLFKSTTVQGPAVFGRNVEAGGILASSEDEPLVVGDNARIHRSDANVKRSVIGPGTHINGANISDATVVPFSRGAEVTSARVDVGTTLRSGSVVFGANIGTGITIYDAHVMGPFVKIGNNSEHDEGFYWGVADDAPVQFPHHGYTETFWVMPVSIGELVPFSDAYYDRLRAVVGAVFSGTLESIEPIEEAPISSSGVLRQAVFRLDGEEVGFPAQRINFGANTITSDYDPRTGARASGSAMAGVATGVDSVIKFPALLEFRTLVGNLTQADGEVSLGTLLLGSSPHAELTGYRAPAQGFTLGAKIAEEVKVQMDYFRRVGLTAQVAAEAASRAQDPYQLWGFAATVRALRKQYSGISKRYRKVLSDALDVSLANLRRQYAAESDQNRRGRLASRIVEHLELVDARPRLLNELAQIGSNIDAAARVVASVTQPQMAEWIRQQTLQPGTPWTNPLAAGLEQEPARLAPAPVALPTPARSGLVPVATTTARVSPLNSVEVWTQVNLLPQLHFTPEILEEPGTFGIIAGPADDRALAAGVALSRRSIGPNREPVPVVFIVTEDYQFQGLIALGVSTESIIRVDPAGKYKTVDSAVNEATAWLKGLWKVNRVVPLGVTDPVPHLVLGIFRNVLGVRTIDDQILKAWQQRIDDVYRFLQA